MQKLADPTKSEAPAYIIVGPLRFVEAYVHTHNTWVKRKWVGQRLIDIIRAWFKGYPLDCYLDAIARGQLKVNGRLVTPEYALRDTELIAHSLPRIEQAIYALPPRIVYEDENFYVVDKPPDMICHESSQQYYNSLQQILLNEYKVPPPLHLVHRLDGVTSGIVIFSKNSKIQSEQNDETEQQGGQSDSTSVSDQNSHEKYFKEKVYLARVHGNFPDNLKEINLALYMPHAVVQVYEGNSAEEMQKLNVKQAQTLFEKLWYDEVSDTSLVRCQPVTGRTHQIRVHLSHSGHAILNDIKYGGKFVGNLAIKHYFPQFWAQRHTATFAITDQVQTLPESVFASDTLFEKLTLEERKKRSDICSHPREICLHSLQYRLHDKTFTTEMPFWALQSFEMP